MAGTRAKNLRRQLTVSEARVWSAIKAGRLGVRFRRQVPIGHWIADFACLSPKLVLEIDDPSHDWRDDTRRAEHLESLGFGVLRFTNKRVAMEFEGVVSTIETWVIALKVSGHPPY